MSLHSGIYRISSRYLAAALLFSATFAAGRAPGYAAQDAESQAEAAYHAGDYGRSADLYLKAIASGDSDPILDYNAACALALSGQGDAAMAQLRAAIAHGFHDPGQLQRDSDLESLRQRTDWAALKHAAEMAQIHDKKRWGDGDFATPFQKPLSRAEKEAGLALIWAEARYGFANFDLAPQDLDWNKRYLEFIPRVAAAKTTLAYYRELDAFIAGLHDGHSSVTVAPEARPKVYSMPAIRTERIGSSVVVTRISDPSLPVHVGDVIRAIDGQPVDAYAEARVAPYVSASTPQDRKIRIYDYALLQGSVDQPVSLELADASGATKTVSLARHYLPPWKDPAPVFSLNWEPHDVAYVRLRSFESMKTADLWHEQLDGILERARGIVFDVRDNGGGNSNVGYAILADILDQPTATSSSELTVYRATLRAWGLGQRHDPREPGSIDPAEGAHFSGPVAILIGPRTYSAAEDFVVAFDTAKRGVLVGSATGGSTGQPLSFPLPGGGSARVCTKRDRFADGHEFVGVGVPPDIEVEATLKSVRAGSDPALERALAWIEKTQP